MTTNTLMAKSLNRDRPVGDPIPYSATLLGHTEQCVDVARLFNEYATAAMVRACGTVDDKYVDWFRKALLLAASTHDLGKASNSFEDQLIGNGKPTPYYVRHEVISYWVISKDSVMKDAIQKYFISSETERLIPLVEGAILSHHLKFPRKSVEIKPGRRFWQGPIKIYQNRLQESGVIGVLGSVLGVALELGQLDSPVGTEAWVIREVLEPFNRRVDDQNYTDLERMLGSMLRGALIAVDTIGSLQFETPTAWSNCLEMFRASWQSRVELSQTFKDIVEAHLKGKERHPTIDDFQEQVAKATADIVIVEAGCGLGKTVSAYKRAGHMGPRGLVLSFPTTSVASQAFEEYAREGGMESQLLHGRSQVDMEFLLPPASEFDETNSGKKDTPADIEESLRRLMAPITFCTVDTVLGLLQMRRSSLCLLPVLCQSMIVFDEVHSYSPELFKHLLAFSRYFHLPMVLMTATLPPAYRMSLQTAVKDKSVTWIHGPLEIESRPRYRVQISTRSTQDGLSDDVLSSVREAVHAGQKVLIVLNQVKWAKAVFLQLAAISEIASVTHLLHSRFKYLHRRQIQQELVGLFRGHNGALIAITTQICEVSFDISADLLISNVAPFSAMVQRLGRLNRGPRPDSLRLGTAIFTHPQDSKPYGDDGLATGHNFASYVQNRSEAVMSQLDLKNWLNETNEGAIHEKLKKKFTWFDEGTATLGNSLREAGYTMDVILRSDFNVSVTPTDRLKFVMPLPLHYGKDVRAKKWRHYSIVDDEEVEYSDKIGGDWRHV